MELERVNIIQVLKLLIKPKRAIAGVLSQEESNLIGKGIAYSLLLYSIINVC